MVTCRFGIRRHPNGESESCFEVFDRMTGATVESGMRRGDAEADAHRRNHGASGPPPGTERLHPPEFAALCAVIDDYVAWVGNRSLAFVARAAQALDELHDELAHADRLIAEQQARIAEIYTLFIRHDGARR